MIAAVNSNSYTNFETKQLSVRSLFSRIQEAVHTAFTTLKALKWELGFLTLGALVVAVALSWKVALVAWFVGVVVLERYWAIKMKEYTAKAEINKQFLADGVVPIELNKYKSQLSRVFKDLIETSWGKRWFKMENSSFQRAFEQVFHLLLGGTCLGQTLSLLKLMPTHADKSGAELLDAITVAETVKYQLIQILRLSLETRKKFAKWSYFSIADPQSREKKIAKVAAAAAMAKREEDLIPYQPAISFKEEYTLDAPMGKEAILSKALHQKLAAFQGHHPGAIVAASINLKYGYWRGSHAIFVQFNGGHYRIYDICHGLYQFPNQKSLIDGLYSHLGKDESGVITRKKIESLKVRFFLIQA